MMVGAGDFQNQIAVVFLENFPQQLALLGCQLQNHGRPLLCRVRAANGTVFLGTAPNTMMRVTPRREGRFFSPRPLRPLWLKPAG
jgi:hypothetical protein